jgi:hypothetical protein
MFQLVRHMVAALLNRFRRFSPPEDPYAAVREPRRRNPSGGSSAVALAEPEPQKPARAAAGTRRNRTDSYEGQNSRGPTGYRGAGPVNSKASALEVRVAVE